jgi:hypothetical protein
MRRHGAWSREVKKKERIERELRNLKMELTAREMEIKTQVGQIKAEQEQITQLSETMKEVKNFAERSGKELQLTNMRVGNIDY